MTSEKTKTTLILGLGGLFLILFFGAIAFLVYKGMQPAIQRKEAAQAEQKNPVEYHVLHTPPAQSDDDLKSEMVGTWKLAGAKSRRTHEFVYLDPANYYFKIYTLTNWAIATYDAGSNLVYSAGGPYTLQGDTYTETIQQATGQMRQYLGARPMFHIRVDGDKYYQMGVGRNPSIEEMWQRVGP